MTFEDALDKVQEEIKKSQEELERFHTMRLPDNKQWEMYSHYVMYIKDRVVKSINLKFNVFKYSQVILAIFLLIHFVIVYNVTGMLATGISSIFLTIVGIPALHEKYRDKKKNDVEYMSNKYKKLHQLYYKDGEYYRYWFITYVLRENAEDYKSAEELKLMQTYYYADNKEMKAKLETKILNMKQASIQKNHWINSLPTSRFLSFKEVEQVCDLRKSLNKLKRNDATIKAFEEYMKQKEEKRKERYLMTYLEEIKLTLEQNGFEVTQEENSLFVNGKEIYLEQTVINLDGEPVVDIQSLIEILSN